MKGGYQIIDFKGADVMTEGGITVKGAFEKCSAGKAMLFENISLSALVIKALFAYVIAGEDNYISPITFSDGEAFYNGIFTVTNEDVVTFTIIEPEAKKSTAKKRKE